VNNEPNLEQFKPAEDDSDLAPEKVAGSDTPLGYGVAPLEEPHLLDYWRIVYRRRHMAVTAFAVVVLATAVYTFTATPIYEGRVQLLIEADTPKVVNFAEVINEAQSRQDYYQTQYRLLQSRSLAKATLDKLKLWQHEELGGAPEDKAPGMMAGVFASVSGLFSSAEAAEPPLATETEEQQPIIRAFLDKLSVSPIRNSRLVDVSYRSADPKIAAQVANELADSYINQNLDYRFTSTQEATTFLGEQIAEQRKRVEATELALQKYREQNDAVALDDRQDIVVQKLADLNAAVTKAKTERLEKEALYNQLRTIQNNSAALDTFPAILSNTFIQQQKAELANLQRSFAAMGEKLGERHPDMVKVRSQIELTQTRLQGEIGKEVQSVRNQFLAAQAQENSLVQALEQQKQEALGMNRKGIEYGVLQRDAESNRQIYDSLLKRANETGVSGELKTSNIRVVDRADVPMNPVSPRRSLNLLLAIFGGAFLGLGLVFFTDYLDNRIKTPEDIVQHLGLPSLGMIPAAPKPDSTDPMIDASDPIFSEAFRALRTNVLFSSAEEGTHTVVVTSTGPGEGKSLVTANLALALAKANQRVLLIDADLRRPRVHAIFGKKQDPGLSNLMIGAIKASDVVQRGRVQNLWILPAGKVPPNPAELLGSKRFNEFLKSLKGHFDWVLIDSPPVMAVADACVIAHRTTGVIFVVSSDTTSRHAARQALEQLAQAHARVIGGVLNRVDLQRNPYYYSKYYRKEYSNYYTRTAS
jgi:polysaccharide biosynthesis transport protein